MSLLKLKAPIKYQLRHFRHVFVIMYFFVYLFMLLIAVSSRFFAVSVGASSGIEGISAITIFITGLNSFKDNFKFFSANGISRKTQLCSTVVSLGILSAAFAFMDTVNSVIMSHIAVFRPLFLEIYGLRFGYSASAFYKGVSLTPQMLIENFIWIIFLYFLCSMAGLLITTLYYRMSRVQKIVVSIAVPTVVLNGIPFLDTLFLQGRIMAFIQSFRDAALGISGGYNPYIGIVSMFLSAAVFTLLTYLLARRATVKK
nr:hypothetical protein [uncultured Caproiciproducens sp.]